MLRAAMSSLHGARHACPLELPPRGGPPRGKLLYAGADVTRCPRHPMLGSAHVDAVVAGALLLGRTADHDEAVGAVVLEPVLDVTRDVDAAARLQRSEQRVALAVEAYVSFED